MSKAPAIALALPLLASLLGFCFAPQSLAATPGTQSAEARYRIERAACLNGSSSQDRTTCLKEAGAARAEARKPGQRQAEPDYLANALARCDRQTEAERPDCRRMVQGAGSSSGSVAEGAIVRELVTRTVGKPAGAASAP